MHTLPSKIVSIIFGIFLMIWILVVNFAVIVVVMEAVLSQANGWLALPAIPLIIMGSIAAILWIFQNLIDL